MLEDLQLLLQSLPPEAPQSAYRTLVVEENLLGKSTSKNRSISFGHLCSLYSFDPQVPVFRYLRLCQCENPADLPLLAISLALARDPLLRLSAAPILALKPGQAWKRESLSSLLESVFPGRYSDASLKSIAQNLNGSWTQSGHLVGKASKTRAQVKPGFAAVAYVLFLGWLCGHRSELLLRSPWAKILDLSQDQIKNQLHIASQRGLLVYKESGGLVDLDYSFFLNPAERSLLS